MMKKIFAISAAMVLICVFAGPQAFADQKKQQTGQQQIGQQQTTPQQKTTQQHQQQTGTENRFQTGEQAIRGSDLIGASVKNPNGDNLGTVNDIIVNKRGDVEYLILSHGGILGFGEELIPIPFKIARIDAKEQVVMVNISKDKLSKAPNFSDWKNLSQPGFDQKVTGYYGEKH